MIWQNKRGQSANAVRNEQQQQHKQMVTAQAHARHGDGGGIQIRTNEHYFLNTISASFGSYHKKKQTVYMHGNSIFVQTKRIKALQTEPNQTEPMSWVLEKIVSFYRCGVFSRDEVRLFLPACPYCKFVHNIHTYTLLIWIIECVCVCAETLIP